MGINKIFVALFFAFFTFKFGNAQTINKYFIAFSDKNHNSYTVSKPEKFLSEKAIQRRVKQKISITETDLPVSEYYVSKIKNLGINVIQESKWQNGVIVEMPSNRNLSDIRALSFVKNIIVTEDNSITTKKAPKFEEAYSNPNKQTQSYNYGQGYNQIHQINGDCMHNNGYKGEGIIIAVLDAGFPNTNTLNAFDSIRNNNQILGGYDFVNNNGTFYDDNSHGTFVLSHIASNISGQLVGTAPHASFYLYRTENASTESLQEEYNWSVASERADSIGVDLITSSLGYNTFDNSATNHTYADMDGNTTPITIAADIAAHAGILVLISAGNEGGGSWHNITAPADADSVLTVGAVNPTGSIAGFSGRGPSSDGRIKPTLCAQGVNTTYVDLAGNIQTGGNGTSFSCPILAGGAACLWQANPGYSNMDIINALKESATFYTNPNNDYGYGIPDLCIADFLLTGKTIEEIKNQEHVTSYPNPGNEELNLSFYSKDSDNITIEIMDISGKIIYTENRKINPSSFNIIKISQVNEFSSGVYMVKMKFKKESRTIKYCKI